VEVRDNGLAKILSRCLPGRTEGNHENYLQDPVSEPRFEHGTFRIRIKRAKCSIETIGTH
jgi:hypothetical protein